VFRKLDAVAVLTARLLPLPLSGRLVPEDLTPQMRDEFVDVFRRWQSEQQ
jgi:hypothetical protein